MTATAQDRAREAFKKAYHLQMIGRFEEAIRWYRKSIEINPTAEAHNFLGWTLSCRGCYEEAIEACLAAVALDPDYGNPYNDIGAYMLELGRNQEAIPWLKRACFSRRYACKHYAHFNLGRAYEARGLWADAIAEYRNALAAKPDYNNAFAAYRRLVCKMN